MSMPQPIGFVCPRCKTERDDPEARDRPGEFTTVYNHLAPKLCDACKAYRCCERDRNGDGNCDVHPAIDTPGRRQHAAWRARSIPLGPPLLVKNVTS